MLVDGCVTFLEMDEYTCKPFRMHVRHLIGFAKSKRNIFSSSCNYDHSVLTVGEGPVVPTCMCDIYFYIIFDFPKAPMRGRLWVPVLRTVCVLE